MPETLQKIFSRNPNEPEFHQAIEKFCSSLKTVLLKHPKYTKHCIFERLTEPDRIIIFRVPWIDDHGALQINRGYRVQFNNALGPYKGGLRFHPSVNLSILKFLAFEQIFKNALTTVNLGGGKGGSDFNPKGKTNNEVMIFCQSFMNELSRHIGQNTDIPAGDIGVGGREIGYMFGQYKKIRNEFTGVLTGKGSGWGGSILRPEATGYGLIYFSQYMLETIGENIEGKICLVSGAGNVAQYAIEKLIELNAKVITFSDSTGYIYDEDGIDEEKLKFIVRLKNVDKGYVVDYAGKFRNAVFTPIIPNQKSNPLWDHKANYAFPSATQNEVNQIDAENLVRNGIKLLAEGSNMSCTTEAINILLDAGVLYGPGKASNAGGVAVSGLEMSQNSSYMSWTREEVNSKLKNIMKNIHDTSLMHAEMYGAKGRYMDGANIAGFIKVADAMIDQGVV
ncbi:MAG: NADP-specific glutamate dehydrogenase [bacterium]